MDNNNKAKVPVAFRDAITGLNKKTSLDAARRCPQCAQADCLPACPLGIDIPGFIRHLREGDAINAYSLIRQQNPFPHLCGHACLAPCERSCIFYADGKSIEIRNLELYAAEFGAKSYKVSPKPSTGKKIAIVGGGIAGLMAAHEFAMNGVSVHILEAASQPGGLLRYGIPQYKLPQSVIDEIWHDLKLLGVVIECNVIFGRTITLPELYLKGFDATVLALGASLPHFIDGLEDYLNGIYYNIDFLSRVLQSSKADAQDNAAHLLRGQSTVIVACGIDGFDAARICRRSGQQVHILWLNNPDLLPDHRPLIETMQGEGITVESIASVDEWIEANQSVSGINYTDASGQKCQQDAQTVILALGQGGNRLLKDYLPQLRCLENGLVWVDEQSRQTSIDSVYACGSLVIGSNSIVDMMADSRKMVRAILKRF